MNTKGLQSKMSAMNILMEFPHTKNYCQPLPMNLRIFFLYWCQRARYKGRSSHPARPAVTAPAHTGRTRVACYY